MQDALLESFSLLWHLDAKVLEIVSLSLRVSVSALLIGSLIGLPLGAWLAVARFRGRGTLVVMLNALMGLPSVIVGVIVYLLLSRSGAFGSFGLLFTPAAMILAQSILSTPLIAAVSRQVIEDAWQIYEPEFKVFRISYPNRIWLLLMDCRLSLIVAVLAGLGRTMSEVGAVMIVGGNIEGYTRVMTTTIALETSKGNLPLALSLGLILMSLILLLNTLAYWVRSKVALENN